MFSPDIDLSGLSDFTLSPEMLAAVQAATVEAAAVEAQAQARAQARALEARGGGRGLLLGTTLRTCWRTRCWRGTVAGS